MAGALKGWARLRNLKNGAVFVTRDGTKAVKSGRVYNAKNPQPLCIRLDTGDYAHFELLDDEWVYELQVQVPEGILDLPAVEPAAEEK